MVRIQDTTFLSYNKSKRTFISLLLLLVVQVQSLILQNYSSSVQMWKLHWPLMDTPIRRKLAVRLMEKLEENLAWFPRYQAYLRQHCPPTLIVWGPEDGYMPAQSARAYHRDLPDAELHLIENAGHWLLETHFDAALPLVREFLSRHHA